MKHRRRDAEWWNTRLRDFVLFIGGFLGVAYETLLEQVDRPALLALFGGMMGLPVFLRRDERESHPDDTAPKPPDPGTSEGGG